MHGSSSRGCGVTAEAGARAVPPPRYFSAPRRTPPHALTPKSADGLSPGPHVTQQTPGTAAVGLSEEHSCILVVTPAAFQSGRPHRCPHRGSGLHPALPALQPDRTAVPALVCVCGSVVPHGVGDAFLRLSAPRVSSPGRCLCFAPELGETRLSPFQRVNKPPASV